MGEKLVSVSLGEYREQGTKACMGVGDPRHKLVPTGDQVATGARGVRLLEKVGTEWPGSGKKGSSPDPYPVGVISRLWRR